MWHLHAAAESEWDLILRSESETSDLTQISFASHLHVMSSHGGTCPSVVTGCTPGSLFDTSDKFLPRLRGSRGVPSRVDRTQSR